MNILYFLFLLLSTSLTAFPSVDRVQGGVVHFSGSIVDGGCDVGQYNNNALKQRCYRSGKTEQLVIKLKKKSWLLPLSLGNVEYDKLSHKRAIVKITYD